MVNGLDLLFIIKRIIQDFKLYRNSGLIHIHSSISFNPKNRNIDIFTDGGRVIRPLLKVKNNSLIYDEYYHKKLISGKFKWRDLVMNVFDNRISP